VSRASRFELALPPWVDAFVDEWARPVASEAACMALAVALSAENVKRGTGGPFGAVVSDERSGRVLAVGVNVVAASGISLAHAEMVALSLAQAACGSWNLGERAAVRLATSCEPCAMCYGALPWSGVKRVAWGARREDAEACGFDEGDKPADWRAALEARGIATRADLMRSEAVAVLQKYSRSNGTIYHPEKT
jgi:tRNA(Arg) A34 adenosine deaminase TadA